MIYLHILETLKKLPFFTVYLPGQVNVSSIWFKCCGCIVEYCEQFSLNLTNQSFFQLWWTLSTLYPNTTNYFSSSHRFNILAFSNFVQSFLRWNHQNSSTHSNYWRITITSKGTCWFNTNLLFPLTIEVLKLKFCMVTQFLFFSYFQLRTLESLLCTEILTVHRLRILNTTRYVAAAL